MLIAMLARVLINSNKDKKIVNMQLSSSLNFWIVIFLFVAAVTLLCQEGFSFAIVLQEFPVCYLWCTIIAFTIAV